MGYNLWAKVLRRFVSPKSGKVDYTRLLKKRHLLDEHVAMLAVFGPSTTPSLFSKKNEAKAYWINAYNALVIFGICEYFPLQLESVTDIKTGFLCCGSSDFHLYTGKRRKRRRQKASAAQEARSLFGDGINIKYNENNDLLLEDKVNNKIFVFTHNDDKNKKSKSAEAKKKQKSENLRRCLNQYWFYEALRFEVDGCLYSLREIEQNIICHKFGEDDARIFCCLSRGCIGSPKLLNVPFVASTLDKQMNAMNRVLCSGIVKEKDCCLRTNYICISSVFRLYKRQYIKYATKNKWQISKMDKVSNGFAWQMSDDHCALIGYVYHFANKRMKHRLSRPILLGLSVKFIEFDWRLSIHKSSSSKQQEDAAKGNEKDDDEMESSTEKKVQEPKGLKPIILSNKWMIE